MTDREYAVLNAVNIATVQWRRAGHDFEVTAEQVALTLAGDKRFQPYQALVEHDGSEWPLLRPRARGADVEEKAARRRANAPGPAQESEAPMQTDRTAAAAPKPAPIATPYRRCWNCGTFPNVRCCEFGRDR